MPLLAMLRDRMQWHQSRQKVLAENIANANTPGFKPHDLAAPRFGSDGRAVAAGGALPMTGTSALHLATLSATGPGEDRRGSQRFEVMPSGNAVTLEDEIMKSGQNQADYQLAATLYQKSLAMLRTAVGKG
jgi:flagellar basal-body rod protein FlgB